MSKYEEASAKYIAAGGFGRVEKIVRAWDQKIVVRKTISIDTATEKSERHVRSEYRAQSKLDHPNIAEYFDVEWVDGQAKFYMDYFPDGSLDLMIRNRSERIPVDDVWAIVYQLSSAVAYCHSSTKAMRVTEDDEGSEQSLHSKVVYHRDIKPQNILWSNEKGTPLEALKLCDFGSSFVLEGSKNPTTRAGTDPYIPPEKDSDGNIKWSTKCDIYSMGCTIYQVCNGKPPFRWSPENEMEATKYTTLNECYSDHELRSLVTECLSFLPDDRPDAVEICKMAKKKLEQTKYNEDLKYQLLLEAIEEGSTERVEDYLKSFTSEQLENTKRLSPLHRAVQYRRINIVRLLLEKGFTAYADTQDEETPLHVAFESIKQSKEKVLSLKDDLSSSADETIIRRLEERIGRLESDDRAMAELLVDNCKCSNTDVWTRYYSRGWSLLHVATAANCAPIIKEILQESSGKLEQNVVTRKEGWSLMHIAAREGYTELLGFLVDRNRQNFKRRNRSQRDVIDTLSENNTTPFFEACRRGQGEVARYLLEKGTNVNIKGHDIKIGPDESRREMTALHAAALWGHAQIVDMLVTDSYKRAAKILSAKTNLGETALHLAIRNHDDSCEDVLEALKSRIKYEETAALEGQPNSRWTALHVAAKNGNTKGARKLLSLGAKPNTKNGDEDTALHLAARNGFKGIVNELLRKGAKASERNRFRALPLHDVIEKSVIEGAAIKKMTDTAKVLINHDRSLVSAESRFGDNAMHLAAKAGNTELAKVIINSNRDLAKGKNYRGETALHLAAEADFIKIVQLLFGSSDLKAKDNKGRTAKDVATGLSRDYLRA